MELLAAAEALEYVQCDCIIHTDSRYVEQGITEWIGKWKQNRWRTSMGKPVKNMDLWQKLDELAKEYTIEWKWVKGHSGIVMHDKIDRLARDMAREYGEKADSTRSQL
jgi:ribonuclease HI